ncbi:hypothetical protein NUW58_g9877 [Xylaria curta]|uniref:Uncharacterized protein n=1 Tax=Xylaria curta TaxID=42375 RepID=A0ACC1MS50_9PEZI|nr:hypothetical protein NUW58_g9877 [Xylaria curta]
MITALLLLVLLAEPSHQQSNREGYGPEINITNDTGRVVLLWTSIALAVFTSLIQGLITTIVQVAEDQGLWTFRFRIARYEHWWWTTVSSLLSVSFALIILTFLAGNNQDALGVLALSTATTIAIVRFAVSAWRNKIFVENRWYAWTGPSRTAIRCTYKDLCGLWEDPTAILEKFGEDKNDFAWHKTDFPCVYDDGNQENSDVSLRWGEDEGFRRRVSRAINAVPLGLLGSRPITVDGYSGKGLCLAFGILGRNKGLRPHMLMFDLDDAWKKHRGIVRNRADTRIQAALENQFVLSVACQRTT